MNQSSENHSGLRNRNYQDFQGGQFSQVGPFGESPFFRGGFQSRGGYRGRGRGSFQAPSSRASFLEKKINQMKSELNQLHQAEGDRSSGVKSMVSTPQDMGKLSPRVIRHEEERKVRTRDSYGNQGGVICYYCNQVGHIAYRCPRKRRSDFQKSVRTGSFGKDLLEKSFEDTQAKSVPRKQVSILPYVKVNAQSQMREPKYGPKKKQRKSLPRGILKTGGSAQNSPISVTGGSVGKSDRQSSGSRGPSLKKNSPYISQAGKGKRSALTLQGRALVHPVALEGEIKEKPAFEDIAVLSKLAVKAECDIMPFDIFKYHDLRMQGEEVHRYELNLAHNAARTETAQFLIEEQDSEDHSPSKRVFDCGDLGMIEISEFVPPRLNIQLLDILEQYAGKARYWFNGNMELQITVPPEFRQKPEDRPNQRRWVDQADEAVNFQLEHYESVGIIRELEDREDPYGFAPLNVVAEAGKKLRITMDARRLNECFSALKIDLPSVLHPLALEGEKFYTKVDFKEAFNHIRFSKDFSRWFCFEWKGRLFCWQHMGFGWNMAPAIFQTIVESINKHLANLYGLKSWGFYDDILNADNDAGRLERLTRMQVQFFEDLGLVINQEKTIIQPSKTIEYLGFELGPDYVGLTEKAVTKYKDYLELFLIDKSYRSLLKVLGLASWFSVIVKEIPATLANINRAVPVDCRVLKYMHKERVSQEIWDMKGVLKAVLPLIEGMPKLSPKMKSKTFRVAVDAATSGLLGFVCEGREAQMPFAAHEEVRDIDYLETLAIKKAIKYAPGNSNLVILSDSRVAYFAFMRRNSFSGFSRNLILEAYREAERKNITFIVEWIGTTVNPADLPSRRIINGCMSPQNEKFWSPSSKPLTWNEYMLWLQGVHPFDPYPKETRVLLVAIQNKNLQVAALQEYAGRILKIPEFFEGQAALHLTEAVKKYLSLTSSKHLKQMNSQALHIGRIVNKLGLQGYLTMDEVRELAGDNLNSLINVSVFAKRPDPFEFPPSQLGSWVTPGPVPIDLRDRLSSPFRKFQAKDNSAMQGFGNDLRMKNLKQKASLNSNQMALLNKQSPPPAKKGKSKRPSVSPQVMRFMRNFSSAERERESEDQKEEIKEKKPALKVKFSMNDDLSQLGIRKFGSDDSDPDYEEEKKGPDASYSYRTAPSLLNLSKKQAMSSSAGIHQALSGADQRELEEMREEVARLRSNIEELQDSIEAGRAVAAGYLDESHRAKQEKAYVQAQLDQLQEKIKQSRSEILADKEELLKCHKTLLDKVLKESQDKEVRIRDATLTLDSLKCKLNYQESQEAANLLEQRNKLERDQAQAFNLFVQSIRAFFTFGDLPRNFQQLEEAIRSNTELDRKESRRLAEDLRKFQDAAKLAELDLKFANEKRERDEYELVHLKSSSAKEISILRDQLESLQSSQKALGEGKKQVLDYKRQVEDLIKKKSQVEQELVASQEQSAISQSNLDELKTKFNVIQEESRARRVQITELKIEIEEKNLELHHIDEAMSAAQHEHQASRDELLRLRGLYNSQGKELSNLKFTSEGDRRKADELFKQLTSIEQDLKAEIAKSQSAASNFLRLKNQSDFASSQNKATIKGLEDQRSDYMKQVNQLESELENLKSKIREQEDVIEAKEQSINSVNITLKDKKSKYQLLSSQARGLQQQIDEGADKIRDLEAQLSFQKQQFENLKETQELKNNNSSRSKSEYDENLKRMERKYLDEVRLVKSQAQDELEIKLAVLRDQAAKDVEKQIQKLRTESQVTISQKDSRIEQLESDLRKVYESEGEQKTAVVIETANKKASMYESKYKQLEVELQTNRNQIAELKAALASQQMTLKAQFDQKHKSADDEKDRLNQEIRKLEDSARKWESECKSLNNSVALEQSQVDELKIKLLEAERSVTRLTAQVSSSSKQSGEHKDEMSALTEQLNDFKGKSESFKKSLDKVQSELTSCKQELLNDKKKAKEDASSQELRYQMEIAEVKAQLAYKAQSEQDLLQKVQLSHLVVMERDVALGSLRQVNASLETETKKVYVLNEQNNELITKVSTLSSANLDFETRIKAQDFQLSQLGQQIQSMSQVGQSRDAKHQMIREALDQTFNDCIAAVQQLEGVQEDNVRLRARLAAIESRAQFWEGESGKLTQERNTCFADYFTATTKLAAHQTNFKRQALLATELTQVLEKVVGLVDESKTSWLNIIEEGKQETKSQTTKDIFVKLQKEIKEKASIADFVKKEIVLSDQLSLEKLRDPATNVLPERVVIAPDCVIEVNGTITKNEQQIQPQDIQDIQLTSPSLELANAFSKGKSVNAVWKAQQPKFLDPPEVGAPKGVNIPSGKVIYDHFSSRHNMIMGVMGQLIDGQGPDQGIMMVQ